LQLAIPVTIAGMSFGALSATAKVALGRAASAVGTSTTTGDGGMIAEERAASRLLVYQCLPSRYGFNVDDLRQADAIEIVIGQGAKPGGGGLLLGQKVTDRVAGMRTLPPASTSAPPPATPTGWDPTTCGSRSRSCARRRGGRSRST
jgi:glutamate synthase domain-containing protein 2